MDFNDLLFRAKETDADMVISCLPVHESDASRMGILQVDQDNLITNFVEKPQIKSELNTFILSEAQLKNYAVDPTKNLNYLASMGIYLFKRQVLIDLLSKDTREDFGKHLIPTLIEKSKVAAYIHQGYWKDIGTIESYHSANLALTKPLAEFNCYAENWPIFSKPITLPGAKVLGAQINHSLLGEGSMIEGSEISHSVIGPRTTVKSGTVIRNTYVMGHEFYNTHSANIRLPNQLQIGKNCTIENAIIDRHVHIGNHVQLVNKENISHYDGDHIYIRDGIIIVSHGASIPDHFTL